MGRRSRVALVKTIDLVGCCLPLGVLRINGPILLHRWNAWLIGHHNDRPCHLVDDHPVYVQVHRDGVPCPHSNHRAYDHHIHDDIRQQQPSGHRHALEAESGGGVHHHGEGTWIVHAGSGRP